MFDWIFFLFVLGYLYLLYEKFRSIRILKKEPLTRIPCRLTYISGGNLSLRDFIPIKVWVTLGDQFIIISPYKTTISTLFFFPMLPILISCKAKIRINERENFSPIIPRSFVFRSSRVLSIKYTHFFLKRQLELRHLEKDSPISFKEQLHCVMRKMKS